MPATERTVPSQGGEPQPLLALEDGEQQRRERHEGEQRLPEAGMDLDERVVREAECASEDERAVEPALPAARARAEARAS